MTKKENSSLSDLEKRVDLLVKRFEEQKGIIDSYIVRERDWKKNKIIQNKEITKLKNKHAWRESNPQPSDP